MPRVVVFLLAIREETRDGCCSCDFSHTNQARHKAWTAWWLQPSSSNIESFNGKLRDELLAREWFDTLLEAKVLIERWRRHFNTVRPHSSLGYVPPVPEAIQPCLFTSATPQRINRAGLEATPTLT